MNRKSIKFLILLGLAVFSFSLIGCEKNHEKILKKLLKEKQEDRCLELIEALEDELDKRNNVKYRRLATASLLFVCKDLRLV